MANLFYGKLTQKFAKILFYTDTCLNRSWTGLGPQTGPIKTDFAVLYGSSPRSSQNLSFCGPVRSRSWTSRVKRPDWTGPSNPKGEHLIF